MLIVTILNFLVKIIKIICIKRATKLDGKEYIIVEILPENKPPNTTLITSEIKAYFSPIINNISKIKILDKPNLAPGIISGGKRLSIVKAIIEMAVKIAVKVIFLRVIFFCILITL